MDRNLQCDATHSGVFATAWGIVLSKTPFIVRVQAIVLGVALCVSIIAAITVGTLSGDGGIVRVAFAIPANNTALHVRESEVVALADRVSEAFGVASKVSIEFSDWILEASVRHKLPTDLIASLVFTESSFRKYAISGVGAIGPAQVRPDYWGGFCGTSDLTDPAENIYCGAQILSYYRDRCGDDQCALQAYNVGPYTRYYVAAGQRYVNIVTGHRARFLSIAL
ncbi:MAG: lytic transglycosylase domain-containing protein [Pseudomonadales bacterium]|nr:lytic transglycosylase domain-containing protein [Pseudomonadales bacterium]